MSQENVEVVRALFHAVASRDSVAVMSLYDPEIEWDGTRHRWVEVMGDVGAKWQGHEGLRDFFRRYNEVWESLEHQVEELIDAGDDVVVAVVTSRGLGRASGVSVEWPDNAAVWTIRDGKVVRVVWYPTRAEAVEAVELSE
jgi:ketosteroid isomerase-like protein